MKQLRCHVLTLLFISWSIPVSAHDPNAAKKTTIPIIKNGETQVVPALEDPDLWIRHDLWVEAEFDSDGDGKLDRMHVSVTRPRQTDSEGLKLPVIYVSSPYFAGVGANGKEYFWNPRQELGDPHRSASTFRR